MYFYTPQCQPKKESLQDQILSEKTEDFKLF